MKPLKLQYLGIPLLALFIAGCLSNNGSKVALPSSTRVSYDGNTEPATLTQSNSATLLAAAYRGGQAGSTLGSTASLTDPSQSPASPRTLVLSEALDNAIQQALQSGNLTPANAAALNNKDISGQVPGSCVGHEGQMKYSGNYNDETREFYLDLTFDSYCDGTTTINGSATASGQTTNNANIDPAFQTSTNPFGLDMFNNTALAPNPFSISFDSLGISYAGSSFTASGSALITKQDEADLDESPDTTSSEPINPDNTPDADNSPTDAIYDDDKKQADVGGTTTIKMDCVLRDDATQTAYKFENFNIALTNSFDSTNNVYYVDAVITGRYYDPTQGYLDITTPTALHITNGDYWPTSGVFHAEGNNDAASFTALSNTTYQLDIDSNNDGTTDSTTSGAWGEL
jgi:hypothetical protein